MSKGIIELAEAYMESHEAVENEDFVDAFLPVLEGQLIEKSLYPIVRLKIKGNYLLKVALEKDLYRVLTVGSEHTFQELHWAIQKAYKFDDDHGYSFYMNGEAGSQSGDRFTDPQTLSGGLDGEKPANAYVIGEAGLYEGMQFLYIFDFGDDWRFNITVLSIQEGAKEPKNIKVVETKGKAPKQYDFDDEDENW